MDKKIEHVSFIDDGCKKSVTSFLDKWFDEKEYIEFKTSGSTGTPKLIHAKKAYMEVSSSNTINFLNLNEGDTALLCLPVDYISGSMMIVRSLVGKLHLYAKSPAINPFNNCSMPFDFVAMTMSQVVKTLENEREAELFYNSKNIIIGGSAITQSLEDKLKNIDTNIYSTYGMTETLSHIALRKIDKTDDSKWYVPLNGIDISLSNKGTLIINAPSISDCIIETTDIAEIDTKGRFRILGRLDNVINTGGVKVQIEDIEEKIFSATQINVVVTYVNDNIWGQKVVMLVANEYLYKDNEIKYAISEHLSKYQRPKHILYIDQLPMTRTGKYDREKAKNIAKTLL